MAEPDPSAGRSVGRRAALIAAVLSVWGGCSVERNYELLSFFFDGVPNPNALPFTSTAGGGPVEIRASPTYTGHPPYLAEECSACHKSKFTQKAVTAEVCSECHDGVRDQFPFMHGPVIVGACLWCHVPHESAYLHLLKGEPRTVCGQCHELATLATERVPEHADEERSCLDCHSGHGSDRRYMLVRGQAGAPGG